MLFVSGGHNKGYTMLGKTIHLFHELNALPIPLDIRRLNHGEGNESTMKKENAIICVG